MHVAVLRVDVAVLQIENVSPGKLLLPIRKMHCTTHGVCSVKYFFDPGKGIERRLTVNK